MDDFIYMTEIWSVPVKALIEHWNPFNAWHVPPISLNDVQDAIKNNWLQKTSYDQTDYLKIWQEHDIGEEYAFHVQRIAYLVKHRDGTPICVSIGVPSLGVHTNGWFEMQDGNHRLAAAVLREDETIQVTYDGQNSLFPVLFPGATICGFQENI